VLRLQAFKFELMPDGEQLRNLRQFAGSCRFVYNKALALNIERYGKKEKRLGYGHAMKCLLFPGLGLLAIFVGTQSFFRGAPATSRETSLVARSAPSLETTAFEFPGAGEPNNNRMIGDFCCTGETATVRSSQGTPMGYIYFYDYAGGINNGSRSAATKFRILVSGTSGAAPSKLARVKSSIEFASTELEPGLSRRIIAGVLEFTVTILDVKFVNEAHSRYWMDSMRVKVNVKETSAAQTGQLDPVSLTACCFHR
jgi:hypothetical protein